MVSSNKVFPSSEQPSSEQGDLVTAFTPEHAYAEQPQQPSGDQRASAALFDNEDESDTRGEDGTPSHVRGKQLAFEESADSYEDTPLPSVRMDALVEFSTESEESEGEEEGDDDEAGEDRAAAPREGGARRVRHAHTHTFMGREEDAAAAAADASAEDPNIATGRIQGFLEALGVASAGPWDRASTGVVATSAASAAILRATSKLHELALGDDHAVRDKWDDYDDENPEKASRTSGSRRGSTSGSRTSGSRRGSASGVSSSKSSTDGANSSEANDGIAKPVKAPAPQAWPAGPAYSGASYESAYGETYEDVTAHGEPAAPAAPGFVYEHATVKVLLWYYLQTLLYSGIVAAISIPLVTLFSSFHWHVDVEVPSELEGIVAPIQPNRKVFQWMMLFWIANPLTLYCPLLLACIKRSIRLPWQMYAVCAFTISWGAIVCTLFYVFDVPYWYWYLDLFIVLAAYVPCMCTVGWFIDEDAGWRDRLWDIAFTATLETVVAAATLLYCWFLMPLFYALQASWQKLLWLCTVHPLYFELTTGFIVRKALHRNSVMGRTNIMYFLTIVHGMAHQVSITTMLQASVEPTRILAVTVLVYNASKLFWRSTVIHRHLLFDRVLKGWSFNFSEEERTELARMVSVHVLTEVVLENASILVTPYLMYRMYEEPLFMMVVPKTFHKTGGAYPVAAMLTMIFTMLSITALFDALFWFLNYHVLQFLPLINTWRRIKRASLWYLCFLIYAFIFMGVLFVFLIMMMLPRGTYCKSDEYCDCATSAYESLCRGNMFTVHHDYLVDIDPSTYI